MRNMKRSLASLSFALLAVLSLGSTPPARIVEDYLQPAAARGKVAMIDSPPTEVIRFFKYSYKRDIRPILIAKCYVCQMRQTPKGKLSMKTKASFLEGAQSGPVLAGTDPRQSILWQVISDEKTGYSMPPRWRPQLTPSEKEVLRQWILDGGP